MKAFVIDTHEMLTVSTNINIVGHIIVPRSFTGQYYPECTLTAMRIRILTRTNSDIILIGNNQGAGKYYARQIPQKMRARVIIISNTELSGEEIAQYALLGIDRFVLRGIALIRLFSAKS